MDEDIRVKIKELKKQIIGNVSMDAFLLIEILEDINDRLRKVEGWIDDEGF